MAQAPLAFIVFPLMILLLQKIQSLMPVLLAVIVFPVIVCPPMSLLEEPSTSIAISLFVMLFLLMLLLVVMMLMEEEARRMPMPKLSIRVFWIVTFVLPDRSIPVDAAT